MNCACINTTTLSCILLLNLPLATPGSCQTETTDSERLYALYEKTLANYHSERFEEALAVAKQIRQEFPDEPAGAFGMLTTYQTMSRNYRVKLFDAVIDSLLDLSVELAKGAIKRDKRDGRNYFYLGCAYGFLSLENAKRKEWMETLKYGSQVTGYFNKAITYSPEFYDAYYGLGLYKYWLGAKGAMRYLPFAKKNREEGLELMRITLEKGHFLKTNAQYGLVAAYYNEEEYDKALAIADELLVHYPNNPTLHYRRGRILQALERWQDAIQSFEALNGILTSTPYESISFQIECLYQLARCHYAINGFFACERLCDEALALEASLDFTREIDGPLEKFDEIQEQLGELREEVKGVVVSHTLGTE